MFVIDASIACGAVLPDEDGQQARAILGMGIDRGMIAPALWIIEVGNTLAMAAKRGRLSREQRDSVLLRVAELPVRLIGFDAGSLISRVMPLADRHGLSVYDATYLATANAAGAGLATLDRRLAAASVAEGIEVVVA